MKNFDFVELIGSLKDLDNRKIYKGSKGTMIELKNDVAVVIFFNEKNWRISKRTIKYTC